MNFATERRIRTQEQESTALIGKARGLLEALKILRELKVTHDEAAWDGMLSASERAEHLNASTTLQVAIACVDDRWEQCRIDIEEACKLRADLYTASTVADSPTVTIRAWRP